MSLTLVLRGNGMRGCARVSECWLAMSEAMRRVCRPDRLWTGAAVTALSSAASRGSLPHSVQPFPLIILPFSLPPLFIISSPSRPCLSHWFLFLIVFTSAIFPVHKFNIPKQRKVFRWMVFIANLAAPIQLSSVVIVSGWCRAHSLPGFLRLLPGDEAPGPTNTLLKSYRCLRIWSVGELVMTWLMVEIE